MCYGIAIYRESTMEIFKIFNPALRLRAIPHDGNTAWKYAEEKLDGHRCTIWRGSSNNFYACGRAFHKNIWMSLPDSIKSQIEKTLPPKSVIEGEIVGGNYCTDVLSAIADGTCVFMPFATPIWDGDQKTVSPYHKTRKLLSSLGFRIPISYSAQDKSVEDLLQIARDKNLEGFVLKQAHYFGWWKLKPVMTTDVVVIKIEGGDGKYRGMMGALIIGQYDDKNRLVIVGKVGTGFQDTDRIKRDWVGKVIEIGYEGFSANQGFRFPRFIRIRNDVAKLECKKGNR